MRVMLATPTLFRIPTVEYNMSLLKTTNLLLQYGIPVDTCFVGGDAFIDKARNGLVESFIKTWDSPTPCDVLVFIDDDQAWDEQAFLRIVNDPHEFIGVAVPKKMDGDPQTFNNVLLDTDDQGNCFVENGMMRISQIGSGFIALKRSCIEKMMKAYPRRYSPGDGGLHEKHYNFFERMIYWDEKDPTVLGQFWGEDLVFCKRWKAIGGTMWLDPNVEMSHVGRKTWTGNFLHYLQKHAKVQMTETALPETIKEIEALAA